jgi:penicillin-binding protein 1A
MNRRSSKLLASHRARALKPRSTLKKKIKTIAALSLLSLLIVIASATVYLLLIFIQVSHEVPSLADVSAFTTGNPTEIYSADGKVLAVLAKKYTIPVKLNQVSKYLVQATIAAEDKRFYEHSGIDIHGILRAVYTNATSGDPTAEGASTITQQLARNLNDLGLSHEKSIRRKVAEAILAMRLEQVFTKDEILQLYLNQVYYGDGAWGIEAASQTYFNKHASQLDLAESAMLAGMPNRPSLFAQNRDAALRRRDWVLQCMVDQGKISSSQRDQALTESLGTWKKPPLRENTIYAAPYFVDYVISRLERDYDSSHLYSGWKVYTTLDTRIQKAAEDTLRDGISGGPANQSALVCIDPKTGYIRAMVGGLDYQQDQFNIAVKGTRQPGSAFKPIVYTAAIDTGKCDLDTTFRDDPNLPGELSTNKWHPKNYSGHYSYSNMSVRTAIEHSVNTIAVKVAMATGIQTVIDYANRMGITTINPIRDAYPTLALGSCSVHPLELCSAYTIFANSGQRAVPSCWTKILDSNGDLYDEKVIQVEDPHIKSSTIDLMNEALQDVVLHGTGSKAAAVPNAHGKTGTTSDDRDAWFAGYTPDLTTVIWAAHEVRSRSGRVKKYLPMPGATGGDVCAPIWRDFMLKAVPIQQQVNQAVTNPVKKQVKEAPSIHKKDSVSAHSQPDNANSTQPATSPDSVNGIDSGGNPDAVSPSSTSQPDNSGVSPSGAGNTGNSYSVTPSMGDTGGRLATPERQTRSSSKDEMVTVPICADSGQLATRWCPTVIMKTMPRKDVPGRCQLHHPPPGESN